MSRAWQPVIGLEIHVQLATRSKLFSGSATAYGAEPNAQACALDLGYPGTLPVPNREAVRFAIRLGLALNATIAPRSLFARKNYFYPDLPKGYQISQYEDPIVSAGTVRVRRTDGSTFEVEVQRAHLEEDAGKSVHDAFHGATALDLNRAGVPLLEIVSAPVLHSAEDATAYLRTVHRLVRWLGISDGNMQEGSFRCDANVSVRPGPDAPLGTRAEIKNVNSFRFVEKAIAYEIERQVRALENGESIVQETRLYDETQNRTRSMRGKESAHDYRYFPDPDLPPIALPTDLIAEERAGLVELPDARRERYVSELALSDYDADTLTLDRATSDYFETLLQSLATATRADATARPGLAKQAANWVNGELAAALNEAQATIEHSRVPAAALAGLLVRIHDGTVSGKLAKDVFGAMWRGEGDADAVIAARGLGQISDDAPILAAIDAMLAANPKQAEQFRAGDEKVFGWLIGQAMKATRGKANPQRLNALLRERLAQAR